MHLCNSLYIRDKESIVLSSHSVCLNVAMQKNTMDMKEVGMQEDMQKK
jgi:hypothetical protein